MVTLKHPSLHPLDLLQISIFGFSQVHLSKRLRPPEWQGDIQEDVTYAGKHLTKETTFVLRLALENPTPRTSELDTTNAASLEGCEEGRGQLECDYSSEVEGV
jgi:hypothetical protein